MRVGLYPGTFDPVTLGHIDIIRRACALVDKLVIGVAINRDKGPLFSLEERVAMIEQTCSELSAQTGVEIIAHPFENLLIDCARDVVEFSPMHIGTIERNSIDVHLFLNTRSF